jgi:hypothetical protein
MTSWTAFVGQVARLRRLIVRVFSRAARGSRHADEQPVVAHQPAPGPPAHWVERVRRGAPGLLEPSLRSRGEPLRPVADDAAVPQAEGEGEAEAEAESETELEPRPHPRGESEGEYTPAEPPATPRPTDAPVRASYLRKAALLGKAPLLRKTPVLGKAPVLRRVLQRKQLPSAVLPAPVNPSPAPPADDMAHELVARTKPVHQPPDRPAAAPRDARQVDKTEPRAVPAAPTVVDEPEHRQHRSNVVEFEAPVQRRSVRAERTIRVDRPLMHGAAPPPATEPLGAEPLFGDVDTGRIREAAIASRSPRVSPDAEPVREPVTRRQSARPDSPHEAAPAFRDRDEPPFAVDIDRWPELPPPLDQADDDVDAALRAWERQRRLDHEQTQL